MLQKRRRLDIEEITEDRSNNILNLLNDDLPEYYISFQLAAFLKVNPIPTTQDIYELYKNSPGELIKMFFDYINFNVNKFMNGKLCTILTKEYNSFYGNKIIDQSPILIDDREAYIYICPYEFGQIFPNKVDSRTYDNEINNLSEYKFILIKSLNNVFQKFINEMNEKYGIYIIIDATDDDVITIEINF